MSRLASPNPATAALARVGRVALPVSVLALVLVAGVLVGRADRTGTDVEVPARSPRAAIADAAPSLEAEIIVVRAGRERRYSSRQLPPDGRLVFRRYVEERNRQDRRHPPVAIAEWIFRVVPEAEEVRITLFEPGQELRREFAYRRDAPSPT